MANVAHSTLTGSDLHENKGAASATDNTVATVTSGATVWKKLTASNLTGTGNPFGAQLFHVRDEKAPGTSNTDYVSSNVLFTRTLNTAVINEISSASLGSNQITLPAGTYFIEAAAPVALVGDTGKAHSRSKLYNVTDSADVLIGTQASLESNNSGVPVRGIGVTFVKGRFTIAGTKVFEIRSIANAAQSITGTNSMAVEVYTDVFIWKVA